MALCFYRGIVPGGKDRKEGKKEKGKRQERRKSNFRKCVYRTIENHDKYFCESKLLEIKT